jgi:hypothetical protein
MKKPVYHKEALSSGAAWDTRLKILLVLQGDQL